MLRRRPSKRLTIEQVQAHPFFSGVDWAAVEAQQVPLPLDFVALARVGAQHLAAVQAEKAA